MIFTDTKDVFVSALFKNKKEGKKDGRFRLGAPTGAQFLSVYVLFFLSFGYVFKTYRFCVSHGR